MELIYHFIRYNYVLINKSNLSMKDYLNVVLMVDILIEMLIKHLVDF